MPYDPSLYSPYGQLFNPNNKINMQQPINGLVKVGSYEGVQLYALPPNSVSPPLFLESDNIFFVKTTDNDGVASIKAYEFEECEVPQSSINQSDYVTRADLEELENRIIGAINGQHTVSEQRTTKSTTRKRKSAASDGGQPEEDGAE